jgi:hypothetical protein
MLPPEDVSKTTTAFRSSSESFRKVNAPTKSPVADRCARTRSTHRSLRRDDMDVLIAVPSTVSP